MGYMEAIQARWKQNDTLLCVGLDPNLTKIPEHLQTGPEPIFEFSKAIIDATADLVCAYKPQIAYFARYSAEKELEKIIDYIHTNYPGIPVILDAKRGDIGTTAEMYAREAFDRYKADAVTVNPYMGGDTLKPYLERKDKGTIILCRTSNPGSRDLQDLEIDGTKLYQKVAQKAAHEWNEHGNIMLVVGATYPSELAEIRKLTNKMPFLVPGIGAQGGNVQKAVENGQTPQGAGMVINSSRGIIYAGDGENFANLAREAAKTLKNEINRFRKQP